MTRRVFLSISPALALSQDRVPVPVGAPAPDFTVTTGSGASWRLSEQRGNALVLVFYRGYW